LKLIKKISGLFSSRDRKHELPRHDAISRAAFQARHTAQGIFIYTKDGFEIQHVEKKEMIKWDTIEKLVIYKEEKKSYDEIRMVIEHAHGHATITEATPGWYQFINRLKSAFPHIPPNWDAKIGQPSFAACTIILYEKRNQ
jgi:hypothetical protein